jgi:spermidine/putrescine transport system permease protein
VTARVARVSQGRRRALVSYGLLAPAVAWLLVFFAIPLLNQLYLSLQKGSIEAGYTFQWNWSSYSDAVTQYHEQFLRSIGYAAVATAVALVISFPLVYFIAFRAKRSRNLLLLLIVLPLFTNFLMRTIAWETILADDSFVLRWLQDLGLVAEGGRLLATRTAVIAGITYNFLPYMALPLYASLDRIDRRLIEAATDLYASRGTAFRKVTLPLALPGIVAGSLLTFIPAVGDYVNATLLGSPQQAMIGNVIQSKFLALTDYPSAAAISFILMALVLVIVVIYLGALGQRGLREAAVA